MYLLVFTPAAKADLKEIYRYGLQQWGQDQSLRYLEKLKNKLWSLTDLPLMGVERSALVVGMLSLSVESHIVFYQVTVNHQVEIIRVLHARQDPMHVIGL